MELFIKKVKRYPCLWDTGDIAYRDIEKKDLAWEDIATKCEIANGTTAKSQWKKLRDSHREALRRRKTITGHAAPNLKPWKYEFLMDFLLPQTEHRETLSNSSTTPQDSQDDTENAFDANNKSHVIESPLLPFDCLLSSSASIESYNNKQINFGANFTDVRQDKEKRREQRQYERDDLRRSMIDVNRVQEDALSKLFSSLCQKTRELPKYLQLRVQREIFDSVTRAEEEALSFDPSNTYYSPTPSTSSYGYTTTKSETSPLPEGSP